MVAVTVFSNSLIYKTNHFLSNFSQHSYASLVFCVLGTDGVCVQMFLNQADSTCINGSFHACPLLRDAELSGEQNLAS